MRSRCIVLLVCLATQLAHAETPAELTSRGEALAKEGRYSEAIVAFKAADAIEPRASHACLIALAYTRRELWPQAEIFLALCRSRANSSDPLPDWVPLAETQLAERLENAPVAEISIEVYPPAARAQVTVSSFAPDEVFAPRTIHLAFGSHLISVEAPDYKPKQLTVRVVDRMPQKVIFKLEPLVPPPPPPPPNHKPWYVMGAGVAVLGVAVGLDLGWLQPARDHLADAADPAHPDSDEYDRYEHTFDTRQRVTLATYGIGAATLATGIVMLLVDRSHRSHRERSVQVSATPLEGGAFVGVTWSR